MLVNGTLIARVLRGMRAAAVLVVLAVLAAGEITGRRLFPQGQGTQAGWRSEVMIWRSLLSGFGWGLRDAIALHRV
jgi:hypothetical protein